MSKQILSNYYCELNDEAKKRYSDKLKMIDDADPYLRMERKSGDTSASVEWTNWPDVSYADLYNYLILSPGFSHEQLKAYKSLEGYNHFVNGWVSSIKVTVVPRSRPNVYVFTALVKHSQRLSAVSLKVWVAIKHNGEIICAHCTCMAGLGETCSHVAALLFTAEANSQFKQQTSSTSLPCAWLPPCFQCVPYVEIGKIDFKTPVMKRKLAARQRISGSDDDDDDGGTTSAKRELQVIEKPSDNQIANFYCKLSETSGKPVILSLVPAYSDLYVPACQLPDYPLPLTELFDPSTQALTFDELTIKCKEIYDNVIVTADQAALVEKMTRGQAKSRLWFQQRSGRITASKLKNAVVTNADNPSPSLIKSICYPESTKFYSVACEYGCKHESTARREYMYIMQKDHTLFEITECGLVIDPLFPFLGATPDGLVTCACCGNGTLEIKCPFSCRKKELKEVAEENSRFFLSQKEDGTLELKQSHQYFYQVQLQMKLCNVEYCDFVAWKKDGDMFHQRLVLDKEFIDEAIRAVEPVITLGILPELVARWFTKSKLPIDALSNRSIPSNDSDSTDNPHLIASTSSATSNTFTGDAKRENDVYSTTPSSSKNSSTDPQCTNNDSVSDHDEIQSHAEITSDENEKLWCYCSQSEMYDDMIGCDGSDCKIQWFHLSCVSLTKDQLPDGEWFCFDCRK